MLSENEFPDGLVGLPTCPQPETKQARANALNRRLIVRIINYRMQWLSTISV